MVLAVITCRAEQGWLPAFELNKAGAAQLSGAALPGPPIAAEPARAGGGYAAFDQAVMRARMAANTLKTIALRMKSLENTPASAPAEYIYGLVAASEELDSDLYDLDLALRARDIGEVRAAVGRMTPVPAKLAKLAKSIEDVTGSAAWGGRNVAELAAGLDRNIRELRASSSFFF